MIDILFTRTDSNYNKFDHIRCWDIKANALNCKSSTAAIYHPPCRAWGQLKHFANPRRGERKLAVWSLIRCNKYGGVLEHPVNSELFKHYKHLMQRGITVDIEQVWFGHKARKPTRLYIHGLRIEQLPVYEKIATEPTHRVARIGKINKEGIIEHSKLIELNPKEREETPPAFAAWLIQICKIIEYNKFKNNGKVLLNSGQANLFG